MGLSNSGGGKQQARRSYVMITEHATAGQALHGKYHAPTTVLMR